MSDEGAEKKKLNRNINKIRITMREVIWMSNAEYSCELVILLRFFFLLK